ncbi:hypothetical protein [Spiroplasma ixodetis]|nr:hypothetical protein [Spiroplasma ixodetis]WJG71405.1 hypothetical protein SIXOD_v1c28430 [Spiroplasma ixodetis Y32]
MKKIEKMALFLKQALEKISKISVKIISSLNDKNKYWRFWVIF